MAVAPFDNAGAESPKCETIEELFESLEPTLLGYALRLIGERTVAEDLVQEAFLKLHAQFEQVRQPRAWLFRTVHNLALNQLRGARKIVPLAPPNEQAPFAETPDPQPLPDEQIIHCENVGLVRLSLEALDARSRQLINLKFVENLSYKEISARTGLTVGHVGYLLHHALKEIARELAKSGGAR